MKYELKVFEDFIALEFEGISMEYRIQYDITGRILNVHPIFHDLPFNAQKMIYGEKVEVVKTKMSNYGQLLQVILPLGINYQSTFYTKELGNVYEKINKELDRLKITVADLYCEEVGGMSIRFLIHCIHIKDVASQESINFLKAYLNRLMTILRDPNKESGAVSFLGYEHPMFGLKLIPLLIPVLNDTSDRQHAYGSLAGYKEDKKCFDYLSLELKTTNQPEELYGILKALSEQEFYADEVKERLIEIYNSEIKLGDFGTMHLIKTLGNYPAKETTNIALDLAKKNIRSASKEAISVLFNAGYPPKRIVRIILDKLNTDDIQAHEIAYNQMIYVELLFDYLPNCFELISCLKKSMKMRVNRDVAYAIGHIISYKYKKRIFGKRKIINRIEINLNNENKFIMEGFLGVIDKLTREKSFNPKKISSKDLLKKYFELLENDDFSVKEKSASILKNLGIKNRDKNILTSLIARLNKNDPRRDLLLLESIIPILASVKYMDYLTPIFMEFTKHDNPSIRAKALQGLLYSSDNEMKKKLLFLKDDPNYLVQHAVSKLYENLNSN